MKLKISVKPTKSTKRHYIGHELLCYLQYKSELTNEDKVILQQRHYKNKELEKRIKKITKDIQKDKENGNIESAKAGTSFAFELFNELQRRERVKSGNR